MFDNIKVSKVCLCVNDSCPKKSVCYRYMKKGTASSSYNEFTYSYRDGFPVCKYFLTMKEGEDRDG